MPDRLELKYLISHETRQGLLDAWRPYLTPAPHTDVHAVYPILSLYLDSPTLRFYDEKVDGEMLRNKVRMRGYGYRWDDVDPCFLEVKRKVDSRIIKLRKNIGAFEPGLLTPDRWMADFENLEIKPEVRPLVMKEMASVGDFANSLSGLGGG